MSKGDHECDLGMAKLRQQTPDGGSSCVEAAKHFERAVELDPSNATFMTNAGVAYQLAIQRWHFHIGSGPLVSIALFNAKGRLGQKIHQEHDVLESITDANLEHLRNLASKALHWYAKSFKAAPGTHTARAWRAQLLRNVGAFGPSLKDCEAILADSQADADLRKTASSVKDYIEGSGSELRKYLTVEEAKKASVPVGVAFDDSGSVTTSRDKSDSGLSLRSQDPGGRQESATGNVIRGPSCQIRVKLPENYSGKNLRCPKCHAVFKPKASSPMSGPAPPTSQNLGFTAGSTFDTDATPSSRIAESRPIVQSALSEVSANQGLCDRQTASGAVPTGAIHIVERRHVAVIAAALVGVAAIGIVGWFAWRHSSAQTKRESLRRSLDEIVLRPPEPADSLPDSPFVPHRTVLCLYFVNTSESNVEFPLSLRSGVSSQVCVFVPCAAIARLQTAGSDGIDELRCMAMDSVTEGETRERATIALAFAEPRQEAARALSEIIVNGDADAAARAAFYYESVIGYRCLMPSFFDEPGNLRLVEWDGGDVRWELYRESGKPAAPSSGAQQVPRLPNSAIARVREIAGSNRPQPAVCAAKLLVELFADK